MAIKKQKPSLGGILKRRRTTVPKYFANLGVTTHEQLVTVLESLLGRFRVSEQLQEEAFAWIATLKTPEVILQKEEVVVEPVVAEVPPEKPEKPVSRPTGRSKTKRKTQTKKKSPPKSSNEEEE